MSSNTDSTTLTHGLNYAVFCRDEAERLARCNWRDLDEIETQGGGRIVYRVEDDNGNGPKPKVDDPEFVRIDQGGRTVGGLTFGPNDTPLYAFGSLDEYLTGFNRGWRLWCRAFGYVLHRFNCDERFTARASWEVVFPPIVPAGRASRSRYPAARWP